MLLMLFMIYRFIRACVIWLSNIFWWLMLILPEENYDIFFLFHLIFFGNNFLHFMCVLREGNFRGNRTNARDTGKLTGRIPSQTCWGSSNVLLISFYIES